MVIRKKFKLITPPLFQFSSFMNNLSEIVMHGIQYMNAFKHEATRFLDPWSYPSSRPCEDCPTTTMIIFSKKPLRGPR